MGWQSSDQQNKTVSYEVGFLFAGAFEEMKQKKSQLLLINWGEEGGWRKQERQRVWEKKSLAWNL